MISRPSDVTLKPWSPLELFFKVGLVADKQENIKNNKNKMKHHLGGCPAINQDVTQDSLGHFGIQEVKRVIFLAFFKPGTPLLRFHSSLLGAAGFSFILGEVAVRLCENLLDATRQQEGGSE